MFVKVPAGNHPYRQPGDFLIEVHPPIYFDYTAMKLGEHAQWESWQDEDGKVGGTRLMSPGDVDFSKAVGASIDFLHMLEFTTDQTQYEHAEGMIAFRYVWWEDPKTGITAVVTTRNIFIVSDQGKTIDRV